MIYLLYGQDSFQVHRALEAIRARLTTPDGMLASNTVTLDGAKLEPLELMQHATVVPFLAPARLVIVEGLLAAIGTGRSGRKKKGDDPLAAWADLADQLGAPGALPETTTLVLVEGDLDTGPDGRKLKKPNPAFTLFAPIAQTKDHPLVKDKELATWVRAELKHMDLTLNERAIRALVDAVGPDLWAMHNELRKIEAYANGEEVDEALVAEIVGQAREAKLWDLTEAVVAGDERRAIDTLASRLTAGDAAPMLVSMIARQYRQLVVVKELMQERASKGEVARSAGIPEWKVDAVSSVATRYEWPALRRAYELLVDADLSVKRGLQDDESALQLLIHKLIELAPRTNTARQPAYNR